MHPIVPYARTAYATGFAASGGPLTDRVRAGCVAAVELAVRNADHPAVLEATLHLGKLEGTWAAVFDRRLKLHATVDAKLRAAWRRAFQDLPVANLASAVRSRAGLTEAADPSWLASLRSWISDQAEQMLQQNADPQAWHDLAGEVRDAIDTARAEGEVGAVALAADSLDIVGFDFDVAFEHAYAALARAGDLADAGEADTWLSTLLGGVADDVGRTLAAMARDGASGEDMRAALASLVEDGDSRALAAGFDLLTSRAMSQGALDLYRSEGVAQVDFITAGDQRVCTDGPNCAAVEDNSPYPLADAPVPGLHPLCRCVVAATVPLPGDVVNAYLGDVATSDEEPAEPGSTLAQVLQTPIVATRPLGGGVMGDTSLVTHEDGTRVVQKVLGARAEAVRAALNQADAEELAALVGPAVGVRVPELVRAGATEVIQEYLDGKVGEELIAWGGGVPTDILNSDDGRLVGLFDALIANGDRNPGNWIVMPDGTLAAIDHGLAFEAEGSWLAGNEFLRPFVDLLSDGFAWAATNDMSPADMALIAERLQRLRPEFARLRRLKWFDAMMRRMRQLASAASGTVSRLEP